MVKRYERTDQACWIAGRAHGGHLSLDVSEALAASQTVEVHVEPEVPNVSFQLWVIERLGHRQSFGERRVRIVEPDQMTQAPSSVGEEAAAICTWCLPESRQTPAGAGLALCTPVLLDVRMSEFAARCSNRVIV